MSYEMQMFPPEIIALNQEVSNHPPLCHRLAEHADLDWTMRLACIAAYCEVILDGMYSPTDLLILCDTLTQKLKEKRTLVINTCEARTITVVPHLEPAHKDDPAAGGKIILSS